MKQKKMVSERKRKERQVWKVGELVKVNEK